MSDFNKEIIEAKEALEEPLGRIKKWKDSHAYKWDQEYH
jgi:hypothetical protein